MNTSCRKELLTRSQNHWKWVRMKWTSAGLGFKRIRMLVQNSAARKKQHFCIFFFLKIIGSFRRPFRNTHHHWMVIKMVKISHMYSFTINQWPSCQSCYGDVWFSKCMLNVLIRTNNYALIYVLTNSAVVPVEASAGAVTLILVRTKSYTHACILTGVITAGIHCKWEEMHLGHDHKKT